jgi:hypothetical protein
MDIPSISSITSKVDTTLTDTMASIKSGAAFSKASSALGDLGAMATSLPAAMQATLAASAANLQASINASLSTLNRDVGISKTSIDLQNKLAFAASGNPASDSVIAAAAGPMAVLSTGPDMLKQQASDMAAAIAEKASHFGASITSSMSSTDAAKAAGAAMSSFVASIPDQYVRDTSGNISLYPNNAPMISSVYTDFVAANQDKMGHISDLTSTISSKAAAGEQSMKDTAAAGAAALAAGIATIKTLSTMNILTGPGPALIVAALGKVVDYTKVPVANVTAQLNKTVPSVPTTIPGITT